MTEEAIQYLRRNVCVNCALEDDCNGDADCLTSKAFVEGVTTLENRLKEAESTYASLQEEVINLKNLLRRVIDVTWGEGWNYSLDVKVEAEKCLK